MIPHTDGLPESVSHLLNSPAAPIVLTPKAWLPGLPEAIAPGLDCVGIMLPANPLQHLLMADVQSLLVMTSGNLSGKPRPSPMRKRWTSSGILLTVFCCITVTSCNGWMIPW
jgi:hydrogenase maturation protein HypF